MFTGNFGLTWCRLNSLGCILPELLRRVDSSVGAAFRGADRQPYSWFIPRSKRTDLELTSLEPFGEESILRICTFQRRSTQSRRRLRGQSDRFAPNLYRSVASLGISVYNELTEYICIGLRGGSLCRQQVIS